MPLNFGSTRRAGPDVPKLRTERINKGNYQYSYNGRMVEVDHMIPDPGEGSSPCWNVIINGEWDQDYPTKRQAVEHAKRILGYTGA